MYSSQNILGTHEYQIANGQITVTKEYQDDKNGLQCNICGLIISNKWNFTLHMRIHNNDRRYKCNFCPSTFITAHDLKRHALAHEGIKPRFKCQFCPKTYASRHSRYLHEDTHDRLQYKCRYCSEIFSKFVERKKHEKEIHHTDNIFFNCSVCNKKFTSRRFLENHEKNYHKKEEDGFKCEECGMLLSTSANLNIHRRIHTNKIIIINTTDPEGYQNKKVKTLKKKTPVELFGIRIHECIICTKRFTSRGDMLAHMSAAHPEENKAIFKYACNMCEKSFKCKQGLSQHLVTHNGEKKFNCTFCDYKSKRSADLKVHMRKHTGEAPYICEKCGRSFQQVKSFQYHKKQHFGKIFKCDLCDSSFYRNRELDWHKQRHSLGGFKCFRCGKLLANPYSLKSHLRVGKCVKDKLTLRSCANYKKVLIGNVFEIKNKNIKLYECFACGYSTLSNLDMTQHQVIHRSNKKSKLKNHKNEQAGGEMAPFKEQSSLIKMLGRIAEKVDYKGIIFTRESHTSPALNEPFFSHVNVENLPLSLVTPSTFVHSGVEKLQEKICSFNGKFYLPLEGLKCFDSQSVESCIKILTEREL